MDNDLGRLGSGRGAKRIFGGCRAPDMDGDISWTPRLPNIEDGFFSLMGDIGPNVEVEVVGEGGSDPRRLPLFTLAVELVRA